MDKYYEQMTQAYKSSLHEVYHYLSIGLAVVAALTIMPFYPAALISAGLAVLFYFLKQKEYVEYEYIFTSGEIDIDTVIEAKKRKKIINFDIRDVAVLAPKGSSFLDSAPHGKKIVAYPKNSQNKIYVAVVRKDNTVNEIYFTPDEEFINLCFRSNPKNVKKENSTYNI